MRAAFTKAGGALGETGSVSFMWDRVGEIYLPGRGRQTPTRSWKRRSKPAPTTSSRTRTATRSICAFENLGEVSKALEAALGEAESVKIIWKPQNNVPVDEERAQSLMKLVGTLEDDDDVQNVYANFEVDDETMAKLSAA